MNDHPEPLRGERDLARLLSGMQAVLDPSHYVFCRMREGLATDRLTARGIFHESEGVTLILEQGEAERTGLVADFVARRIELTVHSDLQAVGFMARIASELAAAGIPCNAVAALYHDHLYVPAELAERALAVLGALEQEARNNHPGVMYEVRVRVDRGIAGEWLAWMESVHIPEIMATGCFRRCTVQRAPDDIDDGREPFLLEYLARSPEAYERYRTAHAPSIQQAHAERYAGRFAATRQVRPVAFELSGALA
jgi:uncharacterized protein